MDGLHALLQLLATDTSIIAHLPYILDHLSPTCLAPSPHLQKWVSQVTSLIHSRDPAVRWAAICIAYRTSFLSKSLLIDNAQSWVGAVFPSLSKPEPVPVLRVSMRFLCLVLCTAGHNLEFQRQVAIPNVPKVSSALLTIAENHSDRDIRTSSMRVLAQLIPLYPSLHKALGQRLFALCNQVFGASAHPTSDSFLNATVKLYAVLHFLGGKVGGANLWRTCLDEILRFSWSAWLALRTTFPTSAQLSRKPLEYLRSPDGRLRDPLQQADRTHDNPLIAVTLNLDKLKYGVSAIIALLRALVAGPVKIPIGHLATFCWCLFASNFDDEGQAHFDPQIRIAECALIPEIWMQACHLLSCLARTTQDLLAPHTSKLIMIISSRLENCIEQSQRHLFLRCAYHLLYFCPVVGATLEVNRLLKATISILSPLYLHQSNTNTKMNSAGATSLSKGGKKRRQEYEMDDVLPQNNVTVCVTSHECVMLIAALDVVDQCMQHVELVPSTHSLANRVLLSILLSLPSIPPARFSPDPSFHGRVVRKVRNLCIRGVQGISHAMNKGTVLVLRSLSSEGLTMRDMLHSHVDLLLHPRRPPFVRTLPFIESLSLSSSEESAEETATRQSFGLTFGDGQTGSIASEPQNHPTPVSQSPLVMSQQKLLNSPQERVLLPSIELHPQSITNASGDPSMAVTNFAVPPVAPPLPAVPDVPAGPLQVTPKVLTPAPYIAPMLVDESDHEEVPTIDLGSDSDV